MTSTPAVIELLFAFIGALPAGHHRRAGMSRGRRPSAGPATSAAVTPERIGRLLDATDSVRGCSVPAGTVAREVRAVLAPAHAQRTVVITDEGDRGLIALAACQAYVIELSDAKAESGWSRAVNETRSAEKFAYLISWTIFMSSVCH